MVIAIQCSRRSLCVSRGHLELWEIAQCSGSCSSPACPLPEVTSCSWKSQRPSCLLSEVPWALLACLLPKISWALICLMRFSSMDLGILLWMQCLHYKSDSPSQCLWGGKSLIFFLDADIVDCRDILRLVGQWVSLELLLEQQLFNNRRYYSSCLCSRGCQFIQTVFFFTFK